LQTCLASRLAPNMEAAIQILVNAFVMVDTEAKHVTTKHALASHLAAVRVFVTGQQAHATVPTLNGREVLVKFLT